MPRRYICNICGDYKASNQKAIDLHKKYNHKSKKGIPVEICSPDYIIRNKGDAETAYDDASKYFLEKIESIKEKGWILKEVESLGIHIEKLEEE